MEQHLSYHRGVARPRGDLTPAQQERLDKAARQCSAAQEAYRAEVLAVMAEGASFSEVSKATGLSTSTLQRWRHEAAKA